jgi:hypothetical protein
MKHAKVFMYIHIYIYIIVALGHATKQIIYMQNVKYISFGYYCILQFPSS